MMGRASSATVGLVDGRNVLRFAESHQADERFAAAAAQALKTCLRASALTLDDIDAIVRRPHTAGTAPRCPRVRGSPRTRSSSQTTSECTPRRWLRHSTVRVMRSRQGGRIFLVAAGAGTTAGAALYRL